MSIGSRKTFDEKEIFLLLKTKKKEMKELYEDCHWGIEDARVRGNYKHM